MIDNAQCELELSPSLGGLLPQTSERVLVAHVLRRVVLGHQCYLTIHFESTDDEMKVEFDNVIDAIEWDTEGRCLLVGDGSGTLHFVDPDSGDVLFSHPISRPGDAADLAEDPRILSIALVPPASATPGTSTNANINPSLVCIFDTGDVFGIKSLPVQTICDVARRQPATLAAAVGKLGLLRVSLPLTLGAEADSEALLAVKALAMAGNAGPSSVTILTLTSAGHLVASNVDLALPSDAASEALSQRLVANHVIDVVLLPAWGEGGAHAGECLTLGPAGLSLYDVSGGKADLIATHALPSSPPATASSQPMALTLISTSENFVVVGVGLSGQLPAVVVALTARVCFAVSGTGDWEGGAAKRGTMVLSQGSESQCLSPGGSRVAPLLFHISEASSSDAAGASLSAHPLSPELLGRLSALEAGARAAQVCRSRGEAGGDKGQEGLSAAEIDDLCEPSLTAARAFLALLLDSFSAHSPPNVASSSSSSSSSSSAPQPSSLHLTALQLLRRLQSAPAPAATNATTSTGSDFDSLVATCLQLPAAQGWCETVVAACGGEWAGRLQAARGLVATLVPSAQAQGGVNGEGGELDVEEGEGKRERPGGSENEPSPALAEGHLRRAILSMLPSNLPATVALLLRKSLLSHALHLLTDHAPPPGTNTFDLSTAIGLLPDNHALRPITAAVTTLLLPMLQASCGTALRHGAAGLVAGTLRLAAELCRRAVAFERGRGCAEGLGCEGSLDGEGASEGPRGDDGAALEAVEVASRLVHGLGVGGGYWQGREKEASELSPRDVGRIDSLLRSLRLQARLRQCFPQHGSFPLGGLLAAGLKGAVLSLLWALPLPRLRLEISASFRDIVAEFGLGDGPDQKERSLDAVILTWLRSAVEERLVVDNSGGVLAEGQAGWQGKGEERGVNCGPLTAASDLLRRLESAPSEVEGEAASLARLILACSAMGSAELRGEAVLLLLQAGGGARGGQGAGGDDDDEEEEEEEEREGGSKGSSGDAPADTLCTSALCALATLLCSPPSAPSDPQPRPHAPLPDALYESLQATLRARAVLQIAFRYGVAPRGVDLRSAAQVRALVRLVACRVEADGGSTSSSGLDLPMVDALTVADSQGGMDVVPVLARALFCRAVLPPAGAGEGQREGDEGLGEGMLTRAVLTVKTLRPAVLVYVCREAIGSMLAEVGEISRLAGYESGSESGVAAGGGLSDENKILARRLVRAAGVVAAACLDATSSRVVLGSGAGAVWGGAGVGGGVGGSDLTPDLVLQLRRLSALQHCCDLFPSLAAVQSPALCAAMGAGLARRRGAAVVAEFGGSVPATPTAFAFLDGPHRRACALLYLSPVAFLHALFRSLLSQSHFRLALGAAREMAEVWEGLAGGAADVVVSSVRSPLLRPAFTELVSPASDGELLLDAASQLCALVGRLARGGSQGAALSVHPSDPFRVARVLLTAAAAKGGRASLLSSSLGGGVVGAGRLGTSLCRVVDLLACTELALSVFLRTEGGDEGEGGGSRGVFPPPPPAHAAAGSASEDPAAPTFCPSDAPPAHDGLIMPAAAVVPALLRFSLREMQRRGDAPSSSSPAASASDAHADVTDLVALLQSHDSHLLATRVLCHTWAHTHAPTSHQSAAAPTLSSALPALLRLSLTALARRLLSARSIDRPLSTAVLLALPFDSMVRELKASVPTIQSDFSRLEVVAGVGEEVARVWEHDHLASVFQGLQANARWWAQLTALGLKVDPSAYQSDNHAHRSAAIEAVVPALLDRTGLDLTLAVEYCRHFDLPPDRAVSIYLQRVLAAPPQGLRDGSWATMLQSASQRLPEEALLALYAQCLPTVQGEDYEKITYLCRWLLAALEGEADAGKSADITAPVLEHYLCVCGFLGEVLLPVQVIEQGRAAWERENGGSGAVGGSGGLPYITPGPASEVEGSAASVTAATLVYRQRLNLWLLLSDPWALLTPLFALSPRESLRMGPLATLLGLDPSEFASRRIIASYRVGRVGLAGGEVPAEVAEAVGCISDAATAASTYQALAALESGAAAATGNGESGSVAGRALAAAYLGAGLAVLDAAPSPVPASASKSATAAAVAEAEERAGVRQGLARELGLLVGDECLGRLAAICSAVATHRGGLVVAGSSTSITPFAPLLAALPPLLLDPAAALPRLLELSVCACWDAQLAALSLGKFPPPTSPRNTDANTASTAAPSPSCLVAAQSPVVPAVVALVASLRAAVSEWVEAWAGMAERGGGGSSSSSSSSSGSAAASPVGMGPAALEACRLALIGRLLADTNAASTSAPSAADQSHLPSIGQGWGLGGSGLGQARGAGAPSASERRRREDVFVAFSIAVLVAMGPEPGAGEGEGEGADYVEQLRTVADGRGRAMRRLTARSRFRAAQALFYLCLPASSTAAAGRGAASGGRLFLFCLSGLQEARLGCSEESLRLALDPPPAAAAAAASESAGGAEGRGVLPLALVRTFLHDEPDREDVCELCRDVLAVLTVNNTSTYAASTSQVRSGASSTPAPALHAAWLSLIAQLFRYRLDRVVVTTVATLRGLGPVGWAVLREGGCQGPGGQYQQHWRRIAEELGPARSQAAPHAPLAWAHEEGHYSPSPSPSHATASTGTSGTSSSRISVLLLPRQWCRGEAEGEEACTAAALWGVGL